MACQRTTPRRGAGCRGTRLSCGKWTCLYRAVDSTGATIDFPLSAHRDAASAKRFFQKVLRSVGQLTPRVIHVDQPPAIHPWYMPSAVLNNILLEQDHRAIKRRVKAIQGFRSFWAARRTIGGTRR